MINNVGKRGTSEPGNPTPGNGDPAEAALIERCLAGERAAHDAFYRQHRRQVAANLYRVIGDRRDLDDLIQDVFVIAFRGLAKFRGDARLSTWMYRICVNVALGAIRKKVRRPPPLLYAEPESLAPAIDDGPESSSPERALVRAQEQARVYRLLAKLPDKKRIVLFLHEIEGYDLKEIAYIVDANPVTVRTRLFYAKRDFYKMVAEGVE